jgi:hypothetical protein
MLNEMIHYEFEGMGKEAIQPIIASFWQMSVWNEENCKKNLKNGSELRPKPGKPACLVNGTKFSSRDFWQ